MSKRENGKAIRALKTLRATGAPGGPTRQAAEAGLELIGDLLEACEASLVASEHMAELLSPVKDLGLDVRIGQLRAAISKARGETE